MLLKRLYDKPEGWEPDRAPDGTLRNPLPVRAVSVKHTGTHATQNFSRRMVEGGITQGWISLGQGKLTLHTEEEDLTYTIVRAPGMYCCHCGADLGEDPSGMSGRTHVEQGHAGQPSPDPSNPSGFRMSHAYECVLDEAQHARWNGQAVQTARAAGSQVQPAQAQPVPHPSPRRRQSAEEMPSPVPPKE